MFYRKSMIFFTGLFIISCFANAAVFQNKGVSTEEVESFEKKFQAFDEMLSMGDEELKANYPKNYTYREAWKDLFDTQNTKYFQRMLDNGNNIFSLTTRGTKNTFLHFIVGFENLDLVKLFPEHMDINVKNSEGFTSFLSSIIIQNVEIIEFFLDHSDTDLSAKDVLGNNVFHIVFFGSRVAKERKRILDLLFKEEHFTKISHLLNEKNKDGQTALDLLYREHIYGKNMGGSYELQRFIDKGAEVTLDLVQLFKSDKITDAERVRILNLTQKIQIYAGSDTVTFAEKDVADLIELSESDDINETSRRKVLKFIRKVQKQKEDTGPAVIEDETMNLVQTKRENTHMSIIGEEAVFGLEQNDISMFIDTKKGEGIGLVQDDKRDNNVSIATEEETDLSLFLEIVNSANTREKAIEQMRTFIDSGYNLEGQTSYHGHNFLHGLILAQVDIQVIETLMEYRYIGINDRDSFGNAPIHRLVENLNLHLGDSYSKQVLFLLLNHPEINLNARNQDGKTALELSQRESIREKIAKREKELKEMSKEDRDRSLQQLKTSAYICRNTFN